MARAGPASLALLVLPLLLAGCATNPSPLGDADAAHAGVACPPGTAVVAFNAAGAPVCDEAPSAPNLAAGFECPQGQFMRGFDADGRPRCGAPISYAEPRATPTTEATQEVSSNLKVTGIYGVRNATSESGLWDLKINVELSAGAVPMDLTKLVIRYSDGSATRNYAHGTRPLDDAAPASTAFNATWIRGDGNVFVMEPGDLVQIHFNLVAHALPTRTPVEISLIPETGAPIAADFKTPATYSTFTIVTLR